MKSRRQELERQIEDLSAEIYRINQEMCRHCPAEFVQEFCDKECGIVGKSYKLQSLKKELHQYEEKE